MTDFITLDDAAALVGPGVKARTLRTAREQGLLRCVETLTRVYGHMIPGALKRAVDAVVRKA